MGEAQTINYRKYNDFCRNLVEGSVLYNIDSTNLWGEYLLVVNKTTINIGNIQTYTLLLIGLKKENGKYIPRNLKISFTPEYAHRVSFLKYVGMCKFDLLPILKESNINSGLVAVYGSADLHKFAKKLNIRKPQKKKYDKEGKPIIKQLNN